MKTNKRNRFILFILYLSSSLVKAMPYETLNIANITRDLCHSVTKERHEGVLVSTYIALRDHNIKKLMDSKYTIWDGTLSGKQLYLFKTYGLGNKPSVAYLYLHSDYPSRTRYYQRRGCNWFEISLNDFGVLISRLEVQRTLDINDNPDGSVFVTQKHNFFGLPATVILPRTKFYLTSVTDDSEVIWESPNSSTRCTCVIVHGHKNRQQLVHLHVIKSRIHYEFFYFKHNKTWMSVLKSYFYFKLEELDNEELTQRRRKELEREQIRRLEQEYTDEVA